MKISIRSSFVMATLLAVSALPAQGTRQQQGNPPGGRAGVATPPAAQTTQCCTFDFQQQEISAVLYAIAEAGKLNLTVGNFVSGKRISLRVLQPLTTREQFVNAIRGIAEDNDLIYNESANLIRVQGKAPPVIPTAQQVQQQQQQLQQAAIAEANRQSIHSYQLKHVSAATLAPVLTALFQSGGGGRGGATTGIAPPTTQQRAQPNTGRGGAAGGAAGGRGGGGGGRGGGGGDELAGAYDLVNPMNGAGLLDAGMALDTLWTLDPQGNPVIGEIRRSTTVQNGVPVTTTFQAVPQQGAQANPLQALQTLFGGGGNAANQVLAPRIVGETSSNQLLILANDADWEKIQQVLQSVDLRPLQVLIEVTIAEVSRTSDLTLGVSGSLAHRSGNVADTAGRVAGAVGTARDFILRMVGSKGEIDYNVALNALQSRGDVRVLSLPIVIAQNNLEATLNVGQRIPFASTTQTTVTGGVPSTVTAYTQQDVGTVLTITPTINRDGYVNMVVSQTDNSASPDPAGTGQLIVSTREASTNVFLRDGQTTVIGGLSGKSTNKNSSGIPILSSIPFLGPLLFGSKTETSRTSELFLFLTPHIISSDADIDAMKAAIQGNSELLKDMPVGGRITKPDTTTKADSSRTTTGTGGGSFR